MFPVLGKANLLPNGSLVLRVADEPLVVVPGEVYQVRVWKVMGMGQTLFWAAAGYFFLDGCHRDNLGWILRLRPRK